MDRNGNGSMDFERGRYGRDDYRRRNDTGGYGRGYDRQANEQEGYGRYAMGGRDYSTSGRYFDEEDRYARGRKYGGMSRYSDEERPYNMAGYGGGRKQSDFYMGPRDMNESRMSSDFYAGDSHTQREGEGGEYGYSPSDDYRRSGYGRYDRGTDMRDYGPRNRMTDPDRGGWRSQQWNRSDYARGEREGNRDYNDSGREDRFIDEEYTIAYRQGQRGRGTSTGAWGDFGGWQPPAVGPHTGRGPKGYERSTDRIREDICERLTQHGHIDASEMEIKIENGEVTLTGTVDSRRTKRLAEDIAESVPGVRDVHNQLHISRTGEDRGEQRIIEQENGQTSGRGSKRPSQQT